MPTLKQEQTVYIIEDDADLAEAIADLIHSVNLRCLCFNNGIDFLSQVDSSANGCIITDMRLPGLGGMQIQEEINKKEIKLPIIFITGFGDVDTAVRAMKNGAYDFVTKPFNADILLEKVQGALQYFAKTYSAKDSVKRRFAGLTSKELSVLHKIIEGKMNKVIADELNISIKTVEAHRNQIMKKTNVLSLAELVRLSIEAEICL